MRNVWKAALLMTLSALMIAAVFIIGIIGFAYTSLQNGEAETVPMRTLSDALIRTDSGYAFSGEEYLNEGYLWLMLIDGDSGDVIWSDSLPEDVPQHYTLADVASFTRWYLRDYPVRTLLRPDGLLVAGKPRNSVWKHDVSMGTRSLQQLPLWFGTLFLLALGCTLAVSALFSRHWFRKEQQAVDAARSDWINGVSHDIRTPLSMVMGYAQQLESDAALPRQRRQQAAIIRQQSQTIRDLVNDLNLTMRLDCAMQPLRQEWLDPAALLRQTVADFLNSGLAEGHPLEMDLTEPLPRIQADPFLLRRAITNLLINCVRHNPRECQIRVGAAAQTDHVTLWVESDSAAEIPRKAALPLPSDGGAAHGTGLRLVTQIAAAHGGRTQFFTGNCFRCEMHLPVTTRRKQPTAKS